MTEVSARPMYAPEAFYAAKIPWEIGKAQQPFITVADRVVSPLLDARCGTGETALLLAARGHRVTAIDCLEEPIKRAKAKPTERALSVDFEVKDAMTLADWDARFARVGGPKAWFTIIRRKA